MSEYMDKTIKQIDEIDSKDSRWDREHYLSVAKTCGCNDCYCCAVRKWVWNKINQAKESA